METTDQPVPRRKSRSGSQTRKKLHMVTTAYDTEELRLLEEAASRAGLTKASFQRVQSLATPKTRSTRRAPIERETLAKVLGQLGKIGSNLNQLAHSAHLGLAVAQEVEAATRELRGMLPTILSALGAPKQMPRRPKKRRGGEAPQGDEPPS